MAPTYAGIGSRETPEPILDYMRRAARRLGDLGWVLRSGGAGGADSAFESGLRESHPREIWLPWPGFSGRSGSLLPSPEAFTLAATFHPAWDKLSRGGTALHARNCHQILGGSLDQPVRMVLCWTKEGKGSGGTGQALRIAKHHSIPIFDLGKGEHIKEEIASFVKQQGDTV